ncbi:hypothetical protein SAMN05421827_102240 [Pedobacter terrae]|uniref:Uncharacterized protein n=1 Tax=Pedobacter terrae TaxID=405671 RepID=A0A1G7QAL0_9SPHI|nr:hypothetical protein [Pedobacter terrae]SDF95572.1 hypothetical protein SAMN05421827_102240 [Pedobacter terrae]
MSKPTRIEITAVSEFDFEDLRDVKKRLEANKCMENAIICGKVWNAEFVEGILKTTLKDGTGVFVAHAWNCLNGTYFDVTRDFFLCKIDPENTYEYFANQKYSPKQYKINKQKLYSWKSDVLEGAKFLNEKLKNMH